MRALDLDDNADRKRMRVLLRQAREPGARVVRSRTIARLLSEIERYCAVRGIEPTTFGSYAMNESKFVDRLKGGREVLPRTAAKVRRYMAENPPASRGAPDQRADAA